ncbi:hypothetical protein DAPPUDRAFT_307639 [Daphnia pulex]|uniref:Uncharacterized protein n=1 Tax=Daphnia pulex TaxID=6669 RepID=E9H3U3_DAPPU|nr:hypothetical protein DAPPUDRAFT_307639 [Daphnia pulex]|eukprot:EFX73586.1 hypothetical protein DAPPUDRAFT_307639 [Daphnia pulex]
MNFKVFSILAMVALVFVFTTTADPAAEEIVSGMADTSEHAAKDHHAAAAGKAAAAHSHHVKRVKDGKKHHEPISRHAREAKAVPQQHQKGAIAPKPIKAGATEPIHQAPQHAPAVGAASLANKQPSARKPGKPVFG